MENTAQLAKHVREFHFGGNWTVTSVKELLSDVTWEESIHKIDSLNTIATLAYHIHYFVNVVANVLEGNPLEGNDKLSFDHPPISNQADWEQFQEKMWFDAERFAVGLEKLPDAMLLKDFADSKYGTYFRNILGVIEHSHYHLGQISLIKKMIHNQQIN